MRPWMIGAGVAILGWIVLTDRSTEPAKHSDSKELDRDAFLRMQFSEAISTYRAQFTLYSQTVTALVAANVVIVGAAASTQRVSLLLLGSLFPIMLYFIRRRAFILMKPVVLHAAYLESLYGLRERGLAYDFLATTTSKAETDTIVQAMSLDDPEQRLVELQHVVPTTLDGWDVPIILCVLMVVEPGFALLAYLWGWNFP